MQLPQTSGFDESAAAAAVPPPRPHYSTRQTQPKAVVVSMEGLKLKLTCTPALLEKPFSECVIKPFLGVFNKKRGTSWTPDDLLKKGAEMKIHDGHLSMAVLNLTISGSRAVGDCDNPLVTLKAPPEPADDDIDTSSPAGAAADALLALHPQASTDVKRDALKKLRLAAKDEAASIKSLLVPKLIANVAEHACLTTSVAGVRKWDVAAAEAAVLLHKGFLAADHAKAGLLLADEKLGVAGRLAQIFAEASKQPLPRLRFLSPLVFGLSLQPGVATGPHAPVLGDAVRGALLHLSEESSDEVPKAHDEDVAGACVAELARSLFNLLRARAPNPATDEGKATVADMLHCVKTVLKCGSAAEGFAEARYNILQLPLALPEALAFKPLADQEIWEAIFRVLRARLQKYNDEDTEDAGNGTVVPAMVLQKIAENDEAARTAMKAFVFGDAVNIGRKLPGHDPYQPAGIDKWDPNAKLPAGAPLKMLMMKMLTATSFNAKHLAGNLLFALCDDDAEEFAHLCGLGSAAGLLAERGLFAGLQQQADAPVDVTDEKAAPSSSAPSSKVADSQSTHGDR